MIEVYTAVVMTVSAVLWFISAVGAIQGYRITSNSFHHIKKAYIARFVQRIGISLVCIYLDVAWILDLANVLPLDSDHVQIGIATIFVIMDVALLALWRYHPQSYKGV